MKKLLLGIFFSGIAIVTLFLGWQVGSLVAPQPTLTITADPVGAAVYVDGVFRGHAPLIMKDLALGKHVIRLSAAGFSSTRQIITLTEEPLPPLGLTLAPEATASLSVTSEPPGAVVVLNGDLRGRTPLLLKNLRAGQCSLEITKTNYNKTLLTPQLESSKQKTVIVKLRYREVSTLRALIKKNPEIILQYNDLGELLYVLGRYDEAATTYVDGLVACSTSKNHSESNRRNQGKLLREYRNKHHNPKFRKALDAEIMRRVKGGETSPKVFAAFKKLGRKNPREYREILEKLALKNKSDSRFFIEIMRLYAADKKYAKVSKIANETLANQPANFSAYLYITRIVLDLYATSNPKKRKAFLPTVERVFAAARPRKRYQTHRAEFAFEEARFARLKKDIPRQIKYLEKAIAAQRNTKIGNHWRLRLARIYFSRKDYQKTLALCVAIKKTKDRKNISFRLAARLKKNAQRELKRLEKKRQARKREAARKKVLAETARKAAIAKAKAERERKAVIAAEKARKAAAAKKTAEAKAEAARQAKIAAKEKGKAAAAKKKTEAEKAHKKAPSEPEKSPQKKPAPSGQSH